MSRFWQAWALGVLFGGSVTNLLWLAFRRTP